MVEDQGELALAIEYDSTTQATSIEACALLADNTTQGNIAVAYVSLCNSASSSFSSLFLSSASASISPINCNTNLDRYPYISFKNIKTPLMIFTGKKYKPVTLKVQPVETKLPSQFHIIRKIKGDPLAELPKLPTQPANFKPTGHYTLECKEQFNKIHVSDFLLPEE